MIRGAGMPAETTGRFSSSWEYRVFMGALAWASVPLYDWFCRVTGFGGTPHRTRPARTVDVDETIEVRFDASHEKGMPWTFRPVERTMTLRLGETGLAFYEAHNPTDRPSRARPASTSPPFRRAATSPRSPASVSRSRCCSPASGADAGHILRRSRNSTTRTRGTYPRSRCPTPFTPSTCRKSRRPVAPSRRRGELTHRAPREPPPWPTKKTTTTTS